MRAALVLRLAPFAIVALAAVEPALAADGSILTNLENNVRSATQGWQDTVMNAARSLFWILAGIEFGIAAVWFAIAAPSLDTWVAELIRRIIFIGFFLFVLQQGPDFAKAVVDSLFQLGANGGTASPADVFNAGIKVASTLSEKVKFGIFEDNAMAIGIIIAMIVVVISFSLVAAIFVSVLVEMYVGLLAGMIMLGLGGSSFTKDFAIKYLVYAFSVGMKLMALVMIARIGSEILIGLSNDANTGEELLASLVIAGLSVVIFMIAIYVPNIIQGVVQGVSVSSGMEAMRSSAQVTAFAASTVAGVGAGVAAAGTAKAAGAGILGQASAGVRAGGSALAGTAAKAAMGSHGSGAGGPSRSMGLRNHKTSK
ncbi:P-type conjugative transfer protein TrbL (plasmid) [Allorhizobium ampelinum S4]|uniref:P-type conjugative transfer protein TrbL n=1 Tax=Allorhizobium ampelinum (strain ATCC BAA-846 / DSM 112012 / S4) TaxID=311402 RepID=B9K3A8_ALLAM|nr:P-type conjugative transfer protein TrbL [Allorhizobium ampelinum]ACM39356.1 P-type conjugative transfer protein TrbL [Allorhizobium ampelinum S4]